MSIDIEDKTTFLLGIVALIYAITFEIGSTMLVQHFWPLCAFGYTTGVILILSGIKGERPQLKYLILTFVIFLVVAIIGMSIFYRINFGWYFMQ